MTTLTTLTSKYAVIGAGLSGAATAWQLAARGHQVVVLERATPAHAGGSSHGSARIFRYAYPDPLYTRLVLEAKPLWDELERLAGVDLITPSGALDFGDQRNPAHLAQILDESRVEHELLSAVRAAERWPQLRFDTPVLWHPAAGVIDAQTAVESMLRLAVEHQAQITTNWAVSSVERSRHGYRLVSTHGDEVLAERVVVCAGGWLPELLDNLSLPAGFLAGMPALEIRQEQAYHFPYRDHDAAGSTMWPAFVHKSRQIQTYGLPGGRDAGFRGQKVAEYNGGRVLGSASLQDGVVDPENRSRIVRYVQESVPGLVPEPYAETTCLFTNTPDGNFILDRAEGITVISPCSGHGAKFAPLIGVLAADLTSGIRSANPDAVTAEFRRPCDGGDVALP